MPDLSNIPRLSVLVIQGCGLKSFTAPFSKDQFFVQFMASDNELTSLPRDEKGNFLAYNAETEEVNFSGNKFTELPDIFDAKSAYQVGTVHLWSTAMPTGESRQLLSTFPTTS